MGKFVLRILMMVPLILAVLMVSDSTAEGQVRRPKIPIVQPPAEKVEKAEKAGDLRQKLLVAIVKNRVIAAAVKDGMKREKAEATWDKLIADVGVDGLMELAKEASPKLAKEVGEGGPLARLIQWIRDHPEEVAALIKFILSLFALFADG